MASDIFTGSSRYSNDFAAVIDRAVKIASLPLTQMQQERQKLSDQSNALTVLNAKVLALQSTLDRISGTTDTRALSTTNSDSTSIKATFGDTATEGEYRIDVASLGSYTNFVGTDFTGVADPNAGRFLAGSSVTLKIGSGTPIALTAATTLQALADEINSKAGDTVRATIVNVSTTSTPNYTISIQAKKLGTDDITLSDGTTTSTNTVEQRGSKLEYKLNGATLYKDSRSATIAPGVTVDFLKATTSTVTIAAEKTTGAFKTAIQEFMSAYNSVVTEVDKYRSGSSSALAGSSILSSVMNTLKNAINFQGDGDLSSLAVAGIEFDKNGLLILNEERWDENAEGNLSELHALVGDGTSSGFLKAAKGALDSLENADTGLFTKTLASYSDSIKNQDNRIADQQERIDRMQTDLEARMAAADAAIAMLEQQASYFNNMFEAMRTNQKSYS